MLYRALQPAANHYPPGGPGNRRDAGPVGLSGCDAGRGPFGGTPPVPGAAPQGEGEGGRGAAGRSGGCGGRLRLVRRSLSDPEAAAFRGGGAARGVAPAGGSPPVPGRGVPPAPFHRGGGGEIRVLGLGAVPVVPEGAGVYPGGVLVPPEAFPGGPSPPDHGPDGDGDCRERGHGRSALLFQGVPPGIRAAAYGVPAVLPAGGLILLYAAPEFPSREKTANSMENPVKEKPLRASGGAFGFGEITAFPFAGGIPEGSSRCGGGKPGRSRKSWRSRSSGR